MYENLLKDLKKSNQKRKLVLAKRAGYETVEEYKKFLEDTLNGTAVTPKDKVVKPTTRKTKKSNTQVTELNEINLYDDIIYGVEEKRTGVFLGWTPDKKAIISAASELLNSQDREMYTETLFINRVFITNDFEIPKKKLKVTLKEVSKLLGVSVDDIEFA